VIAQTGRASERGESVISVAEVIPICLVAVLTVSSIVLPAFYAAFGREYPDGLALLEVLAWGSGVWAWLYAYASRHRMPLLVDSGWFVFMAWWIVVPYYLFRARGRRAWIPIGASIGVWGTAYVLGRLIERVHS
jgi:hypothetical protein